MAAVDLVAIPAKTNYVTFDDLRLGRSSQQVVGRLLHFWNARNFKKDVRFMEIVLLFLDEKCSTIHGFIPASLAEQYRTVLSAGKNLHYVYQHPQHYVWHSYNKTWRRRKNKESIGRVDYIHTSAEELYYLRILLHVVKGPKCAEDILTVDGVTHEKFRDACYARGLLDNEIEWHDA